MLLPPSPKSHCHVDIGVLEIKIASKFVEKGIHPDVVNGASNCIKGFFSSYFFR